MQGMRAETFIELLEKGDVLATMLSHYGCMSHLPEIYEVFGRDKILDFLDLCAGMTIVVPPAHVFLTVAREVEVYIATKRAIAKHVGFKVVADEFNMEPEEVEKIYTRVKKRVETARGIE